MSVSVVVTLAIKAAAYIVIVSTFVWIGWTATMELRERLKELKKEVEA